MNESEGYNDGTERLCNLKRSFYGLDFLIESEFKQTEADPCLCFRKRGKGKVLLGEAEAEHLWNK